MDYRHFTLLVVGDNPDELIKKYDKKNKLEKPRVVYKYEDAEKSWQLYIEAHTTYLEKYVDADDIDTYNTISKRIEEVKEMGPEGFYLELTYGYDLDEETGDAISYDNPDGKYDTCRRGGLYAMPLINNKGDEVYSGYKKDIAWDKMHLVNREVYEFAWDSVMEGKEPTTENEKMIYDNMKNRVAYFSAFKDRETYVLSNISFWTYAYLDENGWVECDEETPQFEWVKNFYDKYINKLDDKKLITIYECTREQD